MPVATHIQIKIALHRLKQSVFPYFGAADIHRTSARPAACVSLTGHLRKILVCKWPCCRYTFIYLHMLNAGRHSGTLRFVSQQLLVSSGRVPPGMAITRTPKDVDFNLFRLSANTAPDSCRREKTWGYLNPLNFPSVEACLFLQSIYEPCESMSL